MSFTFPSRSPWWRGLKIAFAVLLIPLGIVGLFVPVLQGVLLLLLALALLSSEVPWLGRLETRLRERHPAVWRKGDEWKSRSSDWYRRTFRGSDPSSDGGEP